MKKLVSMIMIFAMAIAVCFSAVGCTDNTGNGDEPEVNEEKPDAPIVKL